MARWIGNDMHQVIQALPRTIAAALTALSIGSLAPLSAIAQTAPPAAPSANPSQANRSQPPASPREFNIYTYMGAVNVCALNENKVEFDKAIDVATSMIIAALVNAHGGTIQGVNNNQKIDPQRMIGPVQIEVIGNIQNMCLDKIPAADKKKVEEFIKKIQALPRNPQPGK